MTDLRLRLPSQRPPHPPWWLWALWTAVAVGLIFPRPLWARVAVAAIALACLTLSYGFGWNAAVEDELERRLDHARRLGLRAMGPRRN